MHDMINYSTFICPSESGKCGKEEEKIQKIEYLEKVKSFLDEVKNIFHSFWKAIIWWKNKNLIKIADTSFKGWDKGNSINKAANKSISICRPLKFNIAKSTKWQKLEIKVGSEWQSEMMKFWQKFFFSTVLGERTGMTHLFLFLCCGKVCWFLVKMQLTNHPLISWLMLDSKDLS